MSQSASKLSDSVADVVTPELERFATSFPSELVLQERLATLFSKSENVSGAKVLQGAQEHGKDVIFYEKGTAGDRRLIACVVKNVKITGTVGKPSGATTVFQQVRQAIKNPHTAANGEQHFVNHVYVISPWPCGPEAMNSIKGELETARGQVEFICGRDLFELFRQHWPDYVYFESNLLSLYLASLETLDDNSAFVNLMMHGGVAIEGLTSLRRIYIPQSFVQSVPQFILADPFPGWRGLDMHMSRKEMNEVLRLLQDTMAIIQSSAIWLPESAEQASEVATDTATLMTTVPQIWLNHYKKAVEDAPKPGYPPLERLFVAPSVVAESDRNAVERISTFLTYLRKELRSRTESLESLPQTATAGALLTGQYLTLSRLRLASLEFPWVLRAIDEQKMIRFEANVLDGYEGSLLVTGSAGFGKTSFSRMSTLADAASFATAQEDKTVPTYVPLYHMNAIALNGTEDPLELFVTSPELRRYISEKKKRNVRSRSARTSTASMK